MWQEWKFKAFTQDCNNYEGQYGDIIINTSTEHFESMDWFDKIKPGTRVILQGNNMPHDDHRIHSDNLKSFKKMYPLSKIDFAGQKDFNYDTWGFSRFMLIGKK